MGKTNHNNQKGILRSFVGILAVALIASIGANIYLVSRNDGSFSQNASDSSSQSASSSSSQSASASSSQSISSSSSQSTSSSSQSTDNSYLAVHYLQSAHQVYVMEAGILRNHLEFMDGKDHEFTYDFTNDAYAELKSKYEIERIAGSGTEFERAWRLMYEFGRLLKHKSDYDNHVDMNALALLEYSLDNRRGINCRAKAQILNEMCLALNIYARKVWLMPNSDYDEDCHVVNEIWDSTLNKWVMLDITNRMFWVDETGTPLSILEIREKGAKQEFCTPVDIAADMSVDLQSLQKLQEKNTDNFLYIMKNMAYTQYCSDYTVGETQGLSLVPTNLLLERKYFNLGEDMEFIISQSSIEKSPVQ